MCYTGYFNNDDEYNALSQCLQVSKLHLQEAWAVLSKYDVFVAFMMIELMYTFHI